MRILLLICDRYTNKNTATNSILNLILNNCYISPFIIGVVYGDDNGLFYSKIKNKNIFHFFLPDECQKNTIQSILKDKTISPLKKVKLILMKLGNKLIYKNNQNRRYLLLKKICRNNKIDYILKISWKLDNVESLIKLKSKLLIHYSVILLDPISVSPIYKGTDRNLVIKKEEELIKGADHYYVPQGWDDKYRNLYPLYKFSVFYFPLIVQSLHTNPILKHTGFTFVHYGNITNSRDCSLISMFFMNNGFKLDLFGTCPKNEKWIKKFERENNNSILYKYDFMVLIDNDGDYIDYLPSKLVTYIGTLKPIIIFGRGSNYTEHFLKNYPLYFYCKNIDDFDNLLLFINNNYDKKCNESVVENYYKNNYLLSFINTIRNDIIKQ